MIIVNSFIIIILNELKIKYNNILRYVLIIILIL